MSALATQAAGRERHRMRTRERDHLLAVAESMLEGARQLPYLEPPSVRRMGNDIREAVDLIDAPSYADLRDEIAATAESLAAQSSSDATGMEHALIAQLCALRERLLTDEDLIYTVVFMPYHASMWDTFHSIWAAAEADPRVETIVVPIPYVDRAPNGDSGDWHLHLTDLPPEVSVTPFTEFDLQGTHPDVIYVHNPTTATTGSRPSRRSSTARPFARIPTCSSTSLMYVSGSAPGEHLYRSPSFEVFDKVIVQSEEIDQAVINAWTSNKVVPLGSPKFDYVRTPGSAVPAEWTQQAEGRIVLLQVTSLATLLNTPAEAIRKLGEVLDVVETSDDLVLWWRPHPLEQATVLSMVPQVNALYRAYEARAQRSDQVIVDTSLDLQRAIHNADAYFGHWSSVVELFGFTGKPIVVQDVNVATDVPRPEEHHERHNAALTAYARPEWYVSEGAINHLRSAVCESGGLVPGQHEYFASLTAHSDGTAGRHIHDYVVSCLNSERVVRHEVDSAIDRLQSLGELEGVTLYAFGHTAATEQLRRRLHRYGIGLAAVLDNNPMKQGGSLKG